MRFISLLLLLSLVSSAVFARDSRPSAQIKEDLEMWNEVIKQYQDVRGQYQEAIAQYKEIEKTYSNLPRAYAVAEYCQSVLQLAIDTKTLQKEILAFKYKTVMESGSKSDQAAFANILTVLKRENNLLDQQMNSLKEICSKK